MAKKVLIVEDHNDLRDLLKFLVESCGYEAIMASNSMEAIRNVKKEIPNLILMDIILPDLNGIETTKIIKEYLNGIDVPIIAVTGLGKSFRREAVDAGCCDLIPKPFEVYSLKPVIRHFLEQ